MTRIAFAFPLADGLHARPASLLQEACLRFDAAVVFRNRRNRRRADAASVLELVGSATVAGDPCLLEVSGAAGTGGRPGSARIPPLPPAPCR